MKKYCPRCNAETFSNARFCEDCGEAFLVNMPSEQAISPSKPLVSASNSKTSSLTRSLEPGIMLQNRYRIEFHIGEGAMGSLYRVWDNHLEKVWALKKMHVLSSSCEEGYELLGRFKHEAQILSRLHHPGLPRVTDFFSEEGSHYLVMDYIEGQNLELYLRREGTPGLPEECVRSMALQILDVLEYLHGSNPPIVYRDLKPSNIMRRDSDGRIFLVDFGIAKAGPLVIKKEGTAIGTEGYSPPEQYEGKSGPHSDLYTLGATIHHLLSGTSPQIPFHFKPIASISPGMQWILNKCLEKEPGARFRTAEEMKNALLSIDQDIALKPTVDLQTQSMKYDESSKRTGFRERPESPMHNECLESFSSVRLTHHHAPRQSPMFQLALSHAVSILLALFSFLLVIFLLATAFWVNHFYIVPKNLPLQTIEISPSGSVQSFSPSPHQASVSVVSNPILEREIKTTIYDCMKAMEVGDLNGHMSYYADTLDIYFNKKNCSNKYIYHDKERALMKYKKIRITVSNIEVNAISENQAEALFDKEWDCRDPELFAGCEKQRLTFRKIDGLWKIVGEEELNVYWVRR